MMSAVPMPRPLLPDARWHAVETRDRTADGQFVYAVRSTGIYCRPSCPSRRPRRDRVQFFDVPAHAERAGFRPCRRCTPNGVASDDPTLGMVQRICRLIDSEPDGDVSLDRLAREAGRSPFYLHRTFKRVVGVTPRQYAAARRLERLKQGLRSEDTVSRAQYEAGFGSSSRLYEASNEALGMTPATYKRGGVGLRIGYVIVETDLGKLLVAGTTRGLCAVRFGPSAPALTRSLEVEFPEAELIPDQPRVGLWAASLRAQAEGIKPSALLPLDVQATAFQLRVWNELRRIPFGTTRTYTQVARAIGRPTAARAVARACATNPTALAIPCHRVVRGDGGMGGYRWGVDKKRQLLAGES